MFKAELSSLDDLNGVARKLLSVYSKGRVYAFYGEMGVGKTTFIKALCREVHVADYVNSPTFAIVNEYRTLEDDTIFHFDFYRINNTLEALDLGCEDYLYSGKYCFIEWPEVIEHLLPENTIKLLISEKDNGTRIIETHK